MQTITAIKPQRNGKRLNIYLDGKFGFGLDLENFVKEKLKVEQNLTESQVEKIVKRGEYAKTKGNALKFAMTRPRSEKELTDWLKRKKVHESLHVKLFNFLKRYDFLNDKKFAKWWVEERLRFNKHSRAAIVNELRLKGIDKFIIEDTMAEFDIDESKIAKSLLTKNMHKWQRYEKAERKTKMMQYLARRGFDWDTIKKATHNY